MACSQLQLATLSKDTHPLLKDRVLESKEDDWSPVKLSAPDEVSQNG